MQMCPLTVTSSIMDNVILIGMPASGKSSVGVILAKTLGMRFIDTDILIQEREGLLLEKIITRRGMDEFLRVEEECVLALSPERSVVATGGSVAYSERAMSHLKNLGCVVYLETGLGEIAKRIRSISARGVVIRPGHKLEDLYRERTPLYEGYADIVIRCERKGIEDIVSEIASAVE